VISHWSLAPELLTSSVEKGCLDAGRCHCIEQPAFYGGVTSCCCCCAAAMPPSYVRVTTLPDPVRLKGYNIMSYLACHIFVFVSLAAEDADIFRSCSRRLLTVLLAAVV
jgi:hypothetical protein